MFNIVGLEISKHMNVRMDFSSDQQFVRHSRKLAMSPEEMLYFF